MGYSLIKQDNDVAYNIREFMCDSPSDLVNLPTDAAPGSTCIVISSSTVYMLNTNKEWKEI